MLRKCKLGHQTSPQIKCETAGKKYSKLYHGQFCHHGKSKEKVFFDR